MLGVLALLPTLAVALQGCSTRVEDTLAFEPAAQLREPIVYGDDDRREYYEVTDTAARSVLAESVVALVEEGTLTPGAVDPASSAPRYGEAAQLCDGEPFADQPAAALCSGVLLDWDLVLTAGHCMRLLALERMAIVFGYYYEAPGEMVIAPTKVYHPIEIVAEALDSESAATRLDYAWIRLDRPVALPQRPARVFGGAPPLTLGQSVVAMGAPGGTPVKLHDGAHVQDLRENEMDFFVADTDTSYGVSGGGAFDNDHNLLGILARGGMDYELDIAAGCNLTHREAAGQAAQEAFTYAHRAVAALCDQDPANSSLCRQECQGVCEALPRPGKPRHHGCSLTRGEPQSPGTRWILGLLLLLARRRGGQIR
jgi:hypothetical protein